MVELVVVITTLTPSSMSCVPSLNHVRLGAVKEDEAGCSAEHLRKAPLVEIFELPSGTLVRSGDVLMFNSLTIFNTLESLLAEMNVKFINIEYRICYQPESSNGILVLQLLLSQA